MTFSFTLRDLLDSTEAYDLGRHYFQVTQSNDEGTDADYDSMRIVVYLPNDIEAWVEKVAKEFLARANVSEAYLQKAPDHIVNGIELPSPPLFANKEVIRKVVKKVNNGLQEVKPHPIKLRFSCMDPESTRRYLQSRYGDPDMDCLLFVFTMIPNPA